VYVKVLTNRLRKSFDDLTNRLCRSGGGVAQLVERRASNRKEAKP